MILWKPSQTFVRGDRTENRARCITSVTYWVANNDESLMCLQEFALRSFEKCPSVSWISEAIMMWVQNIFVCLCLYDDLLYFVSHGLAITPGNWIIYIKKWQSFWQKIQAHVKMSFTFAWEITICWGSKKMSFPSYSSPPEYWLSHSQWIFVDRLIIESPS